MAMIVVVTHEYDEFVRRKRFWHARTSHYLLFDVLQSIERHGHRWRIAAGLRALQGDVAILHVDSTIVDPDYLGLASHYAASINFGVVDISKRRVSGALLAADTKWEGPVIVKTDRNFGGRKEAGHIARAETARSRPPHPATTLLEKYLVFATINDVDAKIWSDASLIVERFIPEFDEAGYAMRTWVFMGERERCSRHVSRDPIVKASGSIRRTPVAVPEALRAERARLAFDYGKFDFVMHDDQPVLLDANRTPGLTPASGAVRKAGVDLLAEGLIELISKAR